MSVELKPEGAISSEQIQTPMAQLIEISSEDRRCSILTIKGILKKGKIMAATKPIVFTKYPFMLRQRI